jgi:hypothetical protein
MLRIGMVVAVGIATPTMAADEDIKLVLKTCIDVVRSKGYPYFDAFYNPATQTVKTNVVSVSQQPAMFPFEKCMTERGFAVVPNK